MIQYSKLQRNQTAFRYFTGLTVEEFERLLPPFKSYWDIFVFTHFIKEKRRERKYGGGNTPRLKLIEDKLLFILSYFRHYPLHIVASLLFELDMANVNRWIHRLTPLLQQTLGYELVLPKRDQKSLQEMLSECPDLKDHIIDGTERRIKRPKDKEKQRKTYSGKKKMNTVKNIILSDGKNRINFLSSTVEGKKHDKKIAEEINFHLPRDSTVLGDLGFLGLLLLGAKLAIPCKKKRGIPLTDTQKQQNRTFSSLRVKTEHAIRGIKISRIVSDTYRNYRQNFEDTVMEIACGLHNFRIKMRFCYT